eukprot:RCo046366
MSRAAESSELNIYDAGITSFRDIKGLPTMVHLKSINLHRNRLTRIECLETLTNLMILDLSSNDIATVGSGLAALENLRVLNLSANRLTAIEGLGRLFRLKRLVLSYNAISSLEGMVQLHGDNYELEYLDLTGNQVAQVGQVQYLCGCSRLQAVHFQQPGGRHANPVCSSP